MASFALLFGQFQFVVAVYSDEGGCPMIYIVISLTKVKVNDVHGVHFFDFGKMSKLALLQSSRFIAQSNRTNFFAICETIRNKSTKKLRMSGRNQVGFSTRWRYCRVGRC
jgi:hypothetical protein